MFPKTFNKAPVTKFLPQISTTSWINDLRFATIIIIITVRIIPPAEKKRRQLPLPATHPSDSHVETRRTSGPRAQATSAALAVPLGGDANQPTLNKRHVTKNLGMISHWYGNWWYEMVGNYIKNLGVLHEISLLWFQFLTIRVT